MSMGDVKSVVRTEPRRRPDASEVLVQDPWTSTWIHAEYRGEANRSGPVPRYKVYSPFFVTLDRDMKVEAAYVATAYRWVKKMLHRGPAPSQEVVNEFLTKDAHGDLVALGLVDVLS